jgi:CRP/FNR family transcriptional regulator
MNNLKNIELFKTLNDDQLKLIESITLFENFNKDSIVFYERDVPEYFYVLLQGEVKIYKVDHKGNEIIVHNFTAPSLIAEMASLEGFAFPATCVCMEDCRFALIKKEQFLNLLKENTLISFQIIRSLTKKIKAMDNLLNRSLIFDATTKVAMYIDKNPEEFKNKKNKIIAAELNITAETLSRVLKKLKELHIINSKLELLNKEKLQMFVNF